MDTKELNALKERAYNIAVEHGFHKDVKPDAYYLGLVMSDMGEVINADRKGLHANVKGFRIDATFGIDLNERFEKSIKGSVEDGIADVVIRLLDFAGMKGFELYDETDSLSDWHDAFRTFEESGLPGLLFILIDGLSDAFDWNELPTYIYDLIYFFWKWFCKMTGSDYDLWWFVKQKMAYDELLPKLNGKKEKL